MDNGKAIISHRLVGYDTQTHVKQDEIIPGLFAEPAQFPVSILDQKLNSFYEFGLYCDTLWRLDLKVKAGQLKSPGSGVILKCIMEFVHGLVM